MKRKREGKFFMILKFLSSHFPSFFSFLEKEIKKSKRKYTRRESKEKGKLTCV